MVRKATSCSWVRSHAKYEDVAINSLLYILVSKKEAPLVSFEELDEFLWTHAVEWINRHSTGAQPNIVLHDQVSCPVKIWIYYSCSNFKQTGDKWHTTKDQLDLFYNTMKKHPMNVGHIILQEIYRVRLDNLPSHLFPCLITALCRQSGLEFV